MAEIAVIGAGLGGLSAAIALAAAGQSVDVYEASSRPGGKAGIAVLDGVEVDTGPSVLTLPEVIDGLLRQAGTRLSDELTLRHLSPAFRYRYPDGACVDIFHDPEESAASVARALGSDAEAEFRDFLAYAARIWDIAAPAFVYGPAPSLDLVRRLGPLAMLQFRHVDPFRTMWGAIRSRVRSPHLRALFARYATYNGSDPRAAPATLSCIAHVEMGLGGWGVEGGVYALVRALVRVARRLGVRLHLGAPVRRVLVEGGKARGVVLDSGERRADAVVCNADVAHLIGALLPAQPPHGLKRPAVPSMSGWTGILKARRRAGGRAPHTVLFPADYAQEFADIFDRDRPPEAPTVYLCAQEPCHGRAGWPEHEPVFVMANAPAEPEGGRAADTWTALQDRVLARVRDAGLVDPDDALIAAHTPADLARAWPGSRGSLYGAASNSMFAAFQRPANRVRALPGLYLASGSAHPGGGMPLCVQSGRQAAAEIRADLGLAVP
ncbi:MAG: phytoene desaturase [Alphaproteobacteria bacterium]|nr:phytoene desaturase [Alphaproteobacteria bacterium]